MENCYKHWMGVNYRIGRPWQPLHCQPVTSSSSSGMLLHFEICWKTTEIYYNFPEGATPQHVNTIRESERAESATVMRSPFLEDDVYSRAVVRLLLRKCGPEHDDMVDWVVSQARAIIKLGQGPCDAVLIGLELVWVHAWYERLLVRNVLGQSFEEAKGRMEPASKSSLESLKKVDLDGKRYNEYESLSCAVCLEELCNQKDILMMSCSHMFHGDCILQWLNKSHYCPICRFEMPTQE